MNQHTVKAYDDELILLNKQIFQMGGLAEMLLAQAFDALQKRDPALSEEVIERDQEIDELQRSIEEHALGMIARRQPVANDLRHIMASLRVAADLERIGDLAKNIAKRAKTIADQNIPRTLMSGLQHLNELALAQLSGVLNAYTELNEVAAIEIWEGDAKMDDTYNSIFREMLTYMMEDPRNIGHCTHLLFVAKNLERIGDHATNIAENVVFMVRGEPLADERPRGDTTSTTVLPQL